MSRFRSEVRKNLFRIPISITKDMDEWLHNLSRTMKASGGYKMPRSYIIRALLDAIMNLDIDLTEIKTEEELESRIMSAIKKYK